jgi:uncharacterized protein with PIN domain
LSRSKRFICDEMLQRAGRWLRAAGYDVLIAKPGQSDRELITLARREGRLLLTRDRGLNEYRGADEFVLLIEANELRDILAELGERLDIDWLKRPFSRCLECNTLLVAAPPAIHSRVPPESLREDEQLLYCPRCDKPYWSGSHVKRMRRLLECFSRGEWHCNIERDGRLGEGEAEEGGS